MGHWNYCSYDSDACHDILDCDTRGAVLDNLVCKDNPSAEMIEYLLTNYCKPSRVDTGYDVSQELYLGVVMWGLHHGVVVARKRLQCALRCAQHLISDTEYLEAWKKPKARVKNIQNEIDQIQKWLRLTPKEFRVQKAVGSI